jgi:predicted nucleic acid-binding protein
MADAGLARVSTQVLQELYATVTLKVQKRLSPEQALRYLERMSEWGLTNLDYPIIREAALLSHAHSLSFWDSLIVAAAARSGARRLYSEDLRHGRKILGVEIVNPFRD